MLFLSGRGKDAPILPVVPRQEHVWYLLRLIVVLRGITCRDALHILAVAGRPIVVPEGNRGQDELVLWSCVVLKGG